MKRSILLFVLLALLVCSGRAATAEQEKTFVVAYRQAWEKSDAKALAAFLSTDGAEPETVELFKKLLARNLGAKVVAVGLEPLSPKDEEELNKPLPMPNGKLYKMPLKPTQMIAVSLEVENSDGSGPRISTNKMPVAERDGKLVIPVPVPVTK